MKEHQNQKDSVGGQFLHRIHFTCVPQSFLAEIKSVLQQGKKK